MSPAATPAAPPTTPTPTPTTAAKPDPTVDRLRKTMAYFFEMVARAAVQGLTAITIDLAKAQGIGRDLCKSLMEVEAKLP